MQNYLIDSHCHLHDQQFFSPEVAEDYIKLANKSNIKKIVCIGTDHLDSLAAQDFASRHENIFWTYGIHPHDVENYCRNKNNQNIIDDLLSELKAVVSNSAYHTEKNLASTSAIKNTKISPVISPTKNTTKKPPIAIGEIGLDYHFSPFYRNIQIQALEKQLQLALDLNLPVVFHIRDAFTDFFPIIKNFPNLKAVVHSFSDTQETLEKILNQTDFYIGVNGLLTFAKIPIAPLDRVMLETDAPFLTPKPHRGKQNHPALIKDIADFLAKNFNTTPEEVAKITTKNTENLFQI